MGRQCGVTRLADITRLDRIGLPVWQAVRPAGHALSVHQGKGATPRDAMIGALCEAIESHCAEQVAPDGPFCPARALPRPATLPEFSDLAADRSMPPEREAAIQWCSAEEIATGAPAWLPFDFVSLDLTRDWDSPFDRSSGGLGAGATEARARQKALLELLENDAVGRWERLDLWSCMQTIVDLDSISLDWFGKWRARLHALGMALTVCALPAVTGHPVFVCLLVCHDRATSFATFMGSACHGDAGTALFGAFAEAVQSRLTLIAGVRDDALPSAYRPPEDALPTLGPLPPLPPGFQALRWEATRDHPILPNDIADALHNAGYGPALSKTLSPPDSEIVVVKAFVPGLGSLQRTARGEIAPCA